MAGVVALVLLPIPVDASDTNLLQVAKRSYKRKKYRAATFNLNQILKSDPDSLKALELRGDCFSRLGLDGPALADYSRALSLKPKKTRVRFKRACIYLEDQKFDLALKDLQPLTIEEPNNAKNWSKLAEVYRGKQRFTDALICYSKIVKIDPADDRALKERGRLYQRLGKDAPAVADFSRSLEINGDDSNAILSRGESYLKLGKLKKAIDDFSSAIKMGNPSAKPYLLRAKAYDKLGKHELAAKDRRSSKIDDFALPFAKEKKSGSK